MKTLRTLGYHYKGENGGHGKGDTCNGKNGLDTTVKVVIIILTKCLTNILNSQCVLYGHPIKGLIS